MLHGIMTHIIVAHRDSGKRMFNFSEWFGTASSVALINVYNPDSDRGAVAVVRQVSYNLLTDMGFDLLREFWPEIAHKLKLPIRQLTGPPPVWPPH